jgi:transcriptional antiterminator RfaH
MHGVETFNPTIEVQRRGRGKLVWVRESLFGCYIFARFDFHLLLEKIRFTPGVSSLVHFGGETPTVSDEDIDHLKATFGESERVSLASKLQEGDSVTILRGPFEGIEATIIRTMPSAKRVQVLMEFLGRTTSIDVALDSVFGR